jgi:hypothetical protein
MIRLILLLVGLLTGGCASMYQPLIDLATGNAAWPGGRLGTPSD